ncbi:hypothetical protein [Candidatus Poriferisodalis sp.]|uniref:hypothetical protein n=1 Tax=Candidatus Poriferisodalis sp. TaxID=3101277 RepID=UPI003B0294D9
MPSTATSAAPTDGDALPTNTGEVPSDTDPSGRAAAGLELIGGFTQCDDLPEVESVFGPGPAYDILPNAVLESVYEYGTQHGEQFGLLWSAQAPGGAVVAAFTGNLDMHRDALASLLPEGTRFDVVQVDHSWEALTVLQDSIGDLQGLQGTGITTLRNRVSLDFVDPTDAALEALAETVPTDMVCLDVVYSVEPPSGPLDVIPAVGTVADTGASAVDTECWWGGYGLSATRCENRVVLPPGLGHVAVHLDPSALPDPAATTIQLLVAEAGCTSGREMGDALRGPQVVETDEAVLVAFAVVPYYGLATCPSSPDTHATVELAQPLGDRALLHGVMVPPTPIERRPEQP